MPCRHNLSSPSPRITALPLSDNARTRHRRQDECPHHTLQPAHLTLDHALAHPDTPPSYLEEAFHYLVSIVMPEVPQRQAPVVVRRHPLQDASARDALSEDTPHSFA